MDRAVDAKRKDIESLRELAIGVAKVQSVALLPGCFALRGSPGDSSI